MNWNRLRGKLMDGKNKTVWEGGLGIRINGNGSSKYTLKYFMAGRQYQATLGDVDFMTKSQALELAYRMKLLAKQGVDPTFLITSFVTHEGIHPGSITFGEFCAIYMERHAREKKKSWLEDQRRIDRHLLPYKKRLLNSFTSQEFQKLHYVVGKKTPTSANRLLEQLQVMFKKAAQWGYLPETFPNPARHWDRYQETKREIFLDETEVQAIGEVLKTIQDKRIVDGIKLYMYTTLRRMELLRLRWDNIDLNRGTLTVIAKNSKNKKAHVLPLSPPALRILKGIERKDEFCPWVFPGDKGGHMSASVLERAWQRIRSKVGLNHVWLHDLRRTGGSWLVQRTGNLPLAAKVLNHTNEQVTEVYARFAQKHMREAVNILGDALEQYLEPEQLPSDQ